MEAFSLLKYWRGGGGVGFINSGGGGGGESGCSVLRNTTTTVLTAVTHHAAETDDDDGPFFDLEFALQDEEEADDGGTKNSGTNSGEENEEKHDSSSSSRDDGTDEEEEEEEEREFNFTISSNSSGNDLTDPNLTLSPSDDLFFKGRLVPMEPSSLVFNSAEPNSRPTQFPVSLLKSATKFRVSRLGFKKSKQNVSEKTESDKVPVAAAATAVATQSDDTTPKQQQQQQQKQQREKEKQNKFFTVKFKVEEVPIVSLFTRDDNSSRKSQKQQNVEDSSPDEKKFSKDVMQKYLKKVKPLYIRVSKRYGEKLKFSGQLSLGSAAKSIQSTPPQAGQKASPPKPTTEKSLSETEAGKIQVKSQKQANIPERLRVACKHLGKSRSASSAVAAVPTQPAISRRDDSLLQQQDGIQSAILHCKRSFNASRDSESSFLPRSVSDPSHRKSAIDSPRKSSDEGKDGSLEP